jgi:hypothetical protein
MKVKKEREKVDQQKKQSSTITRSNREHERGPKNKRE